MSGSEPIDWPGKAFRERLRQPDQRSCGATVLVVARMLLDHAYGEFVATGTPPTSGPTSGPDSGYALPGSVAGRFRYEVLAMHHRVTGPVDASGNVQLPWPRALGTPPWAVARQLSATGSALHPRVQHTIQPAWSDRGGAFDRIAAATEMRRPVPLYVGNRWIPRHVVLALGQVDGRLRCYEPSQGRLVDVDRAAFTTSRLGLAGWDRLWFAILPDPSG